MFYRSTADYLTKTSVSIIKNFPLSCCSEGLKSIKAIQTIAITLCHLPELKGKCLL